MDGLALVPKRSNSDFMKVDMNTLPQSLITLQGIPLWGRTCLRYSIASSSEVMSFLVAQSMICFEVMQLTFTIASIPSSEVGRGMIKSMDTCS